MNAVDRRFDDQTKVLADLVKIPSTRFREAPAQDMMARLFKEDGLGVDRWQIKIDDLKHLPGYSPHCQDYDDAWNVVGAWRPSSPKGRLADPERPYRRRARRAARDVGAQSVRARCQGRLDVWPRRGRHEGRHHPQPLCPARAPVAGLPAGGRRLPAVGGRGGMHRQRRAGLPAARLSRRCRAHSRAVVGRAHRGPGRRHVVPGQGHRPSGACLQGRCRLQCHRIGVPPDPAAARAREEVEREEGARHAFPRPPSSGELQRRQDRRRRLGELGAGLVHLRHAGRRAAVAEPQGMPPGDRGPDPPRRRQRSVPGQQSADRDLGRLPGRAVRAQEPRAGAGRARRGAQDGVRQRPRGQDLDRHGRQPLLRPLCRHPGAGLRPAIRRHPRLRRAREPRIRSARSPRRRLCSSPSGAACRRHRSPWP